MTDSELRLECYRQAGPHLSRTASDVIQQSDRNHDNRLAAARELYDWVTAGPKPAFPTSMVREEK